jgi:uncharacterized membrane protein
VTGNYSGFRNKIAMKKITLPALVITTVFLILFGNSCKKEPKKNVRVEGYKLFPQVRQVIQTQCTISCHAPSLGYYEGMPVILETDSNIVEHAAGIKAAVADPVTVTNKRMPQGGTLPDLQVQLIIDWYTAGGTMNN